jgi:hypothetical protein
MKANVGITDRAIRAALGVALLSLFFILEGGLRWLGLIGLLPLATAALARCPAYLPFGINTGSR